MGETARRKPSSIKLASTSPSSLPFLVHYVIAAMDVLAHLQRRCIRRTYQTPALVPLPSGAGSRWDVCIDAGRRGARVLVVFSQPSYDAQVFRPVTNVMKWSRRGHGCPPAHHLRLALGPWAVRGHAKALTARRCRRAPPPSELHHKRVV